MAAQFDAVARLSVDLHGFAAASRTMTSQGGTMQKVFRDLHNVLNQVDIVEKKMAADLQRTLSVYSAVASAATRYAQAVKALSANSTTGAVGVQNMRKAFDQLKIALGAITGMSEKEASRLQRTLGLYNQMASALLKVNQATALAAKTTQQAGEAEQRRLLNAERLAAAAARTETAQSRLNQQLERERTAAQQAAAAQNQLGTSMGNTGRLTLALRADLSELEQAYKKLVSGITASGQAAVAAAITHEAAFSQVIRVTGETGKAGEEMRKEFEKLTTTLPVSFEELAKIGQLAAQTGVANDQLVRFSDTVVRFSVTTGIASDQVTVLFARIADMLDLPANQMNNFASTILKLGTISAATENEILKVVQSIASASRAFGLSTEEVAGLSGALASLRIPPEWSRGSVTRIFRDLDDASNGAGEGMKVLTEVIGMNADEITALRRTDPGGFFLKFVEGMQAFTREGQLAAGTTRSITDVLSDLGIDAVRDVDFITRLANNFSTLKTQTNEAFLEFARGTELTRQTEIVFGTTRQNIDNLKDAFETFLSKAGDPFAKVIGLIAERLTVAIEAFQEFGPVSKAVLGVLTGMVSVGAAVAAAIALYRIALIKAARTVIAFNQVQRDMNGQALNGRNVWRLYREQQEETRQSTASNTSAQQNQAAAVTATGRAASSAATATGQSAAATNAQTQASARLSSQLSSSMQQYSRVVGATTQLAAAQRSQQIVQNQAGRAVATYAAAWAQTERALPAATAAIRNGTASMQQQQTVARAVSISQQAIATSAVRSADAQLQLGLAQRQAAASSAAAAAGSRGVAASAVAAGVAVRGAVGALTLFRTALLSIGIGVVITALTALFQAMTRTKDASAAAAKAGFDAAGGQTAFGDAIRKDQAAIASGARVIATYTATSKDLSTETRERINSQLLAARQEQAFIEAVGGSITALQEQAKGTGASAQQAQGYAKRWLAADDVIKKLTETLKGNTFQISENGQALGELAVQQAVSNDGAAKNLKALEKLRDFGPSLRESLSKMFSDPKAAAEILNKEIERVNKAILDIKAPADVTGFRNARRIIPESMKADLKTLEDYSQLLTTIKNTAHLSDDAVKGAALTNQAFGVSAERGGKGADAMANGMDDAADSADSLTGATDSLTDRVSNLGSAFNALGGFSSALEAALNKTKDKQDESSTAQINAVGNAQKLQAAQVQLTAALAAAGGDATKTKNAYAEYNRALKNIQTESDKTVASNKEVQGSFRDIMSELEKVAAARLERAQNLVRLSARLPQDVIRELEKLGPEASGFIQQLTTKSDEELKKLAPVLRGAGETASAAFAQGLAQVLPLVAGKGKEVGDTASLALASAVTEAIQSGGSITKAIDGVVTAIKTSQKLGIPLQVAIDLQKTRGDINAVNKIINEAVFSGKLTAEAAVKLKTDLFNQTLADLQARVKDTSLLNVQGKATLGVEQYDRDKQRLIDEGTATTLKNLLGIEGLAKLEPEQYNQALELLKKLSLDTTSSNALGPEGTPRIDPGPYESDLNVLTQKGQDWKSLQDKFLKPVPSVDQSQYRSDLGNMENQASRTGSTIQASLTRTARVSVAYTYFATNSPPAGADRAQIATGGWVSGPGGPRSDMIPAMLSNGEFVVNARAAAQWGDLLQSINDTGNRMGSGDSWMRFDSEVDAGFQSRIRKRGRPLGNAPRPRRAQSLTSEPRMVINVSNTYPQAEPTSVTVNRSLAYAAMLDGTI